MSTCPVITPEERIEDNNESGWDLIMAIGPTNDLESADSAEDDVGSDYDDDPYDEEDDFEESDEEWCSAPGRGGPGLCSDDLCRGAGVCLYEGVGR